MINKDNIVRDLPRVSRLVHDMAKHEDFYLYLTKHCKQRMQERNITSGDIINVLKFGDIQEFLGPGNHPSNNDIFKYKMIGPYFGDETLYREIGVVFLIEFNGKQLAIKIQEIITVMWRTNK